MSSNPPTLRSKTDALAACEARYAPLFATVNSALSRAQAAQQSVQAQHDADVAVLNAYYTAQAQFAAIEAVLSYIPQDAVTGQVQPIG